MRFKNRIRRNGATVHQFVIRGICGNDLPPKIDMVVGAGSPTQPSCKDWIQKIFIYMACTEGLNTHLAKAGTVLSGSERKYLNQLFSHDSSVQSLQLEVPASLREDAEDMECFADYLAKTISHLQTINEAQAQAILPTNFQPKVF